MRPHDDFFAACEQGDLQKVIRLLPGLPDIDVKNSWSRTGLAIAVRHDHFDLARYLVSQGASIHALNKNGTTIFMYAKTPVFETHDPRVLEWLLALGAEINAIDKLGLTVLDYVHRQGDTWLEEWMRERGACFARELGVASC